MALRGPEGPPSGIHLAPPPSPIPLTLNAPFLSTGHVTFFPATIQPCQGSVLSFRVPEVDATHLCGDGTKCICDGILLFEDGAQRALAAFTVWQSLLIVLKDFAPVDATLDFKDPQVINLVSSLVKIPSFLASGVGSGIQNDLISWVIRQETAARTQPVSSYMWASMLKNTSGDWHERSLDALLDAFNSHPSVAATGAGDDASGAGSLKLHPRKRKAVGNWLFRCSPGSWSEVESSGHDIVFQHGPYGEAFAQDERWFIGSTINVQPCPCSPMQPAQSEAFIPLDWSLPLTEKAQTLLFIRARNEYAKKTIGIAVDKRKNTA